MKVAPLSVCRAPSVVTGTPGLWLFADFNRGVGSNSNGRCHPPAKTAPSLNEGVITAGVEVSFSQLCITSSANVQAACSSPSVELCNSHKVRLVCVLHGGCFYLLDYLLRGGNAVKLCSSLKHLNLVSDLVCTFELLGIRRVKRQKQYQGKCFALTY